MGGFLELNDSKYTKIESIFWFDFDYFTHILCQLSLAESGNILLPNYFLLWENCFTKYGCGEISISNGESLESVP